MPKLLFPAHEIDVRINQMAVQIIDRHQPTTPLFVALLRGAAPFASKLMFAITKQQPGYHPEIDYMMISTYGAGRTAGEPSIVTDLAPTTSVEGRTVIVIDDVLDKAVTAHFVMDYLRSRGATKVELAVLVSKRTKRHHPITPDYVCLEADDAWLAGMGMDDAATGSEAYRWREDILIMNQD